MAKGTLQWRRRWARARASVRGRGGSDGAGREQGRALLGLKATGGSGGAREEKMK